MGGGVTSRLRHLELRRVDRPSHVLAEHEISTGVVQRPNHQADIAIVQEQLTQSHRRLAP